MTEVWLLFVPLRSAFLTEMSARWFPLASRESSLECPGILIIAKVTGKRTPFNNFWTQGPFLIVFPLEVRKPHYFHSISESWATPKAYLLSVLILTVLSLAKVQAFVRMYNSACWAKVAIGKDAYLTTSKGVAIAYPAQYLPLSSLNKNHQWTMRSQCYTVEFPVDHYEEVVHQH